MVVGVTLNRSRNEDRKGMTHHRRLIESSRIRGEPGNHAKFLLEDWIRDIRR